MKSVPQINICDFMFIAALFTITKIWEQPKGQSISKGQRKCDIYNGILFSLKKEGNTAICNNMNEPVGHYAKLSKTVTERQIIHDHTYMWNLK